VSHGPPRLATALLRMVLHRALRDEALDELADVHALRGQRDGFRAADHWYWLQVPGFVLRLWLGARLLKAPRDGRAAASRGVDMSALATDVRQTLRGLRRSPGFTVVALLTVALGISANTVIFSVVRAVLLKPLPFPSPERIVQLWETQLDRGWTQSSFTHANFWDVRDQNRTFEAVGAESSTTLTLTGSGEPEQLSGARVSAGFFRALGVAAVIGRTFSPGEDEENGDGRIALLGNGFWSHRFNGDPSVIGRQLTLDGASYTVIGVLPPGEPWLDQAEVFIPLKHRVDADRGSFELNVIGRLRPGVSMEAAAADLTAIAKRLEAAYPEPDRGMGITMQSSSTWVADDGLRRALWILMGSVGLLLLIACVNLANLMLASATGRTRERALRATLGASHGRIALHTLTESLIVGITGAGIGLGLAFGIVRMLRVLQPGDIPRLGEVAIDGWVLAFTALIAIATGVVTGLAPALRPPREDLVAALREGERSVAGGRRQGRLRGLLVGIEVAMSLVLLVGAGLLLRSFQEVIHVDRGFDTEDRVFAGVALPSGNDESRTTQIVTQFLSRLEALPRVQSAAAINFRPLQGVAVGMGYASPDRPAPADDAVPWASWRLITPHYFDAMGVSMLAGRAFNEQDEVGNPWRVIISKRIAEELWDGETAVGRTLTLWKGQSEIPAEVIGVVDDMRDWGLEAGVSRAVYIPYRGTGASPAQIIVHTIGPPTAILPQMRSILSELDADLPLSNVQTLDAMLGNSLAARRFLMVLLAAFAAVALLLALAGVYGVLSYSVARRRAEIGVRIALGSNRSTVLRLIMLQGMRPVWFGLASGVAGALVVTRLLSSLLFEVTHVDAITYAVVAALLAATAAFSCYLPARRATAVDVMTALREE
jgi:putative ABC transport system permease protein